MSQGTCLLHRKLSKTAEKTLPTTLNFQTELVVLLNVLYQPSSKPLASVSNVSRIYWLILPSDDNNNESLQMKVARLEKENTKLKRKELRKKGLFSFARISVAEIFKGINRDNENNEDGPESEEPFEDTNAQFPSSVCTS